MKAEQITAYDRNDFRKWLRKNKNKEKRVEIVLYKRHTGKSAPTHRELMEEAICFGWIDTTIKRLDDNRYIRTFTSRNKSSTWSDNTLRYARELIKQKKMTARGLKYFKLGKKKPTHDDHIPKNPRIPNVLKRALDKNEKANETFKTYPPSHKKMLYRWILSGKRPETREKRVKAILVEARAGKRVM